MTWVTEKKMALKFHRGSWQYVLLHTISITSQTLFNSSFVYNVSLCSQSIYYNKFDSYLLSTVHHARIHIDYCQFQISSCGNSLSWYLLSNTYFIMQQLAILVTAPNLWYFLLLCFYINSTKVGFCIVWICVLEIVNDCG